MIRVLAIGDVVGTPGCEFVRQRLPGIKKQLNADFVIVNGENSAVGNGILPSSAGHLLDSGADVITTGNHVFKRREIYPFLEETPNLIRPGNYPDSCPGSGVYLYDGGRFTAAVINLLGTVYMEPLESPFSAADRLLGQIDTPLVFVDIHGEATSEKLALAYYLDGRVSAVFGTHTHVQTADEQILPGGTGCITDLGMTGPVRSILGVKPECVIARFTTCMPTRFETAKDPCVLCGALFTVEEKSGQCAQIERIRFE
jgi:metallophosphoesterase (TIGR00282 family)